MFVFCFFISAHNGDFVTEVAIFQCEAFTLLLEGVERTQQAQGITLDDNELSMVVTAGTLTHPPTRSLTLAHDHHPPSLSHANNPSSYDSSSRSGSMMAAVKATYKKATGASDPLLRHPHVSVQLLPPNLSLTTATPPPSSPSITPQPLRVNEPHPGRYDLAFIPPR